MVRKKGSFWGITFPSLNHRIHANIKYAFLPAPMYPFIRNRDPYWSSLSKGIFDNFEIYYYYFFYLYVIFVRDPLCIYFVFLYALDIHYRNQSYIVYYNILKDAEAVCARLYYIMDWIRKHVW